MLEAALLACWPESARPARPSSTARMPSLRSSVNRLASLARTRRTWLVKVLHLVLAEFSATSATLRRWVYARFLTKCTLTWRNSNLTSEAQRRPAFLRKSELFEFARTLPPCRLSLWRQRLIRLFRQMLRSHTSAPPLPPPVTLSSLKSPPMHHSTPLPRHLPLPVPFFIAVHGQLQTTSLLRARRRSVPATGPLLLLQLSMPVRTSRKSFSTPLRRVILTRHRSMG